MNAPARLVCASLVLLFGVACSGSGAAKPAPASSGAAVALARASGAVASPSAESFPVLSSTLYQEAADTLELDGEVRNNSGQPAGEIVVHLQLVDGHGKPITLSSPDTDANRTLTPPGEVSAFDFLLPHGKQLARQVAAYQLTAEGHPPGAQPIAGLTVSGATATTAPPGDYLLKGQLTNSGIAPIPRPNSWPPSTTAAAACYAWTASCSGRTRLRRARATSSASASAAAPSWALPTTCWCRKPAAKPRRRVTDHRRS